MLRPQPIGPIPEDAGRVARAAFRSGHPYLRIADDLGTLCTDEDFAPHFPSSAGADHSGGARLLRRPPELRRG